MRAQGWARSPPLIVAPNSRQAARARLSLDKTESLRKQLTNYIIISFCTDPEFIRLGWHTRSSAPGIIGRRRRAIHRVESGRLVSSARASLLSYASYAPLPATRRVYNRISPFLIRPWLRATKARARSRLTWQILNLERRSREANNPALVFSSQRYCFPEDGYPLGARLLENFIRDLYREFFVPPSLLLPRSLRNQPRSSDNIHIASIPGHGTKENERKTELSTSYNQLYTL